MTRARGRLDRVDAGLLALMLALSLFVVVSNVVYGLSTRWVWTRTDGFYSGDQLQYLSWIQSSARHVLISNLFVLRATPADYFQPAIILSGLLVRAGVPAWLALMLWKPVAVTAFFLAARAASRHWFQPTADRRAALVLALLFASLSAVYGSLGVIGDMMAMWSSWGYPFGLIAVALIVSGMLAYGRARGAGRVAWAPGLLGGLATTLHPWQGELMIIVVALAELARAPATLRGWRGRGPVECLRSPELGLPLLTIGLVAVPLLYYFGLGHFDDVWRMAREASRHTFSFSAIAIAIAPLAVVAMLGYRGRPHDDFERLIRMWLPAALVLYGLSLTPLGATPLHAVNGLTIPMALLAVCGVRRWPALARMPHGRAVAATLIVIGIVPANAYTMINAHKYTNRTAGNANFVAVSERRALDWLHDSPTAGGVLTQFYLGEALPGLTGRQVNVGDCIWSEPRCHERGRAADALFRGRLSPAAARRFVADSGARFLLSNCQSGADLRSALGSGVVAYRRFGCAEVYELRAPGPARGLLAGAGRTPSAPAARR